MTTTIIPVGTVHNGRTDPQDSDHWGDVESTILIEERFGDHCLTGLGGFSHVEVVYFFHQLAERENYRKPLRPRGRTDLPEAGVFCDRGPRRPNRIGCTICEVVSANRRELRDELAHRRFDVDDRCASSSQSTSASPTGWTA